MIHPLVKIALLLAALTVFACGFVIGRATTIAPEPDPQIIELPNAYDVAAKLYFGEFARLNSQLNGDFQNVST